MPYFCNVRCEQTFKDLKKVLVSTSIVKEPDWTKTFELMCNVNDFDIGAVIEKRHDKLFHAIY